MIEYGSADSIVRLDLLHLGLKVYRHDDPASQAKLLVSIEGFLYRVATQIGRVEESDVLSSLTGAFDILASVDLETKAVRYDVAQEALDYLYLLDLPFPALSPAKTVKVLASGIGYFSERLNYAELNEAEQQELGLCLRDLTREIERLKAQLRISKQPEDHSN